jgi:hypothetical protein
METPVLVRLRRVKKVKPEFQEIMNEYKSKNNVKSLRGFVFTRSEKLAPLAICQCQCSMTSSCGGGGGGH